MRFLAALLVALACLPAAAAERDEAFAVVRELGRINGLALACRQPEAGARAKQLMLAHVPKLREWGEAFESATGASFVAPAGCPDAARLRVELELLARKLKTLLPASPAPAETVPLAAGAAPRYLLQGPNGRAVMDGDFRGRFQLITFGYTYCPDICPTTLVDMARILRLLGDNAKRLQAILVSVDPERDTPEVLKTYTEFFDPRILGLTGQPEAVRKAADLFGVRYEKVREPGASHYSVDHSAGMTLLGPDGVFITRFAYGAPAEEVAAKISGFLTR